MNPFTLNPFTMRSHHECLMRMRKIDLMSSVPIRISWSSIIIDGLIHCFSCHPTDSQIRTGLAIMIQLRLPFASDDHLPIAICSIEHFRIFETLLVWISKFDMQICKLQFFSITEHLPGPSSWVYWWVYSPTCWRITCHAVPWTTTTPRCYSICYLVHSLYRLHHLAVYRHFCNRSQS